MIYVFGLIILMAIGVALDIPWNETIIKYEES